MTEYIEVVGLNRGGVFRRGGMRRASPDTVEQGVDKLRRDLAAWVRPEDAQAVLDAWRAEVAYATTLPAWATEGAS